MKDTKAPRFTYIGFALISLATVVYELLLTRVFSVTIWYHFAFFVISIALFGMAAGAVLVYVKRAYFIGERAPALIARMSVWFAASIVASFIFHLLVPFTGTTIGATVFLAGLTYIVMSIPFIWSGCIIALILSNYAHDAESLYAADLIGAALGCLLVIYLLSILDAPSLVFLVAALPLLATIAFARVGERGQGKLLAHGALVAIVMLVGIAFTHGVLVERGHGILRPLWVKGGYEGKPIYEKWNAISRIRVTHEESTDNYPFGWGFSPMLPIAPFPNQLYLTIDANAGTALTRYEGATSSLEYLKYDMINAAHVLRGQARVFVIGVGGGRDILSALVFGQAHVTGIEVNGAIIDAITGRFGEFTGHLDRNPRVTIKKDEARSYLSRSNKTYDIIQISLIDTWAATAAGAYTLTENTLYTKEGWRVFFDHLSPSGILGVSRWYFPQNPVEAYRLLALAASSLKDRGIADPKDHIIMLALVDAHNPKIGVTTLLASPTPFSEADIVRIKRYADLMGFIVLISPESAASETLDALAQGVDPKHISGTEDFQIAPPTDDNPFFFQTLSIRNTLFSRTSNADTGAQSVRLLIVLFFIVTTLTLLCIVLPLRISEGRFPGKREFPLLLYFMGIGGGFILIEIAEMQRFIVFLGQPTYALSVVLFTLLLSAGVGSWTIGRIGDALFARAIRLRFVILLFLLLLLGLLHPLISLFTQYSLHARFAITVLILLLPGFFMGMFFSAGIRLAREKLPEMIPWFWGVNGAMSVFASVLAPLLAIAYGFHMTFWVGVACYVLTFAVFVRMTRK